MANVVMKLKMQRTKLGLSQDAVAQYIKVDQSMYARLESGKSKLNLEQLIKIMDFLGMVFTDLDDTKNLPSTNAEIELRKLRADVDRLLIDLNKNSKDSFSKKKLKIKDCA